MEKVSVKYIGTNRPGPVEVEGKRHEPGEVVSVHPSTAAYLLGRDDYIPAEDISKKQPTKKKAQAVEEPSAED